MGSGLILEFLVRLRPLLQQGAAAESWAELQRPPAAFPAGVAAQRSRLRVWGSTVSAPKAEATAQYLKNNKAIHCEFNTLTRALNALFHSIPITLWAVLLSHGYYYHICR